MNRASLRRLQKIPHALKTVPQGLKPHGKQNTFDTAEAVSLTKPAFSRSRFKGLCAMLVENALALIDRRPALHFGQSGAEPLS
jgi:hypothetical protein